MDPRINHASVTRAHTHRSVFTRETWHFSSACQINDRETGRTARHSWHTNATLHVGSLFKLLSWDFNLHVYCECVCVCVFVHARLMDEDCYFWCYHSFGLVFAVWLTVGLALEWLCLGGRRRRGPPISVHANVVDKRTQTRMHTLLPLFICLDIPLCLLFLLFFSLCECLFHLCYWSEWDRARCKVLRIANIVPCAALKTGGRDMWEPLDRWQQRPKECWNAPLTNMCVFVFANGWSITSHCAPIIHSRQCLFL